jgi:hypothetical protein
MESKNLCGRWGGRGIKDKKCARGIKTSIAAGGKYQVPEVERNDFLKK